LRYLIIGGNGFIGRNLAKRTAEGNEVVVVDLTSASDNYFSDNKITYVVMDAANPELVDKFKNARWDCIFNFGSPASIHEYQKDPFRSVETTVRGHLNCLLLSRLVACKYVYPSSGNVYGLAFPNSECVDPKPTNLYGMTKLILEHLSHRNDDLPESLRPIGLRIFAGYGPGEEKKGGIASVVTLFLDNIEHGKTPVIWGNGDQTRDFIYIDDVIDGIISASYSSHYGIVNLGTGVSTSFNQLIDIINEVRGTQIIATKIPKPSSYVEKTRADTSLMQRILDINPVTLMDGVNRLVTYRKTINNHPV